MTTTSYCQYFSDSIPIYRSEPSMFFLKSDFSFSASAKTFVIVAADLFFPFIFHRSVCKGKACWLRDTAISGLRSGYVFLWTTVCQNWSLDDKLQTGAGNWFPASVLWVFMVWNISFGNGVHWYLWSLNQYLCNFYVLIFQKRKRINELNTPWIMRFFCGSTKHYLK